jgi:hypothetical protein
LSLAGICIQRMPPGMVAISTAMPDEEFMNAVSM